jgi:hypothetical protein
VFVSARHQRRHDEDRIDPWRIMSFVPLKPREARASPAHELTTIVRHL